MPYEDTSSLARRLQEIRAPVLVLGNGITALAVVRRLARIGVRSFVVGPDPLLVRSSRFFRGLSGPEGDAQVTARGFEEWLDLKGFDRVILVPSSDNWLTRVSDLQQALPERLLACVPKPQTVRTVVNKAAFAQFLEEHGFPHPKTILLRTPEDLEGVDGAILRASFLKPTHSQAFFKLFARKGVLIGGRHDAVAWAEKIANAGLGAMLQELVPGPPKNQICIDGFSDGSGSICGLFARQWLRKYPDEFGESSMSVSIPLEEVSSAVAMVRRAVDLLSLRGVFSVELKKDERDGKFRFLEINARPWWWIGFTCESGVDVCRMMIQDALGERVTPVFRYRQGLYAAYPSYDWPSYRSLPRRQREGYGALARRWLVATQPIFSWRDPGPAVIELCKGLKSRIVRRHPRSRVS